MVHPSSPSYGETERIPGTSLVPGSGISDWQWLITDLRGVL